MNKDVNPSSHPELFDLIDPVLKVYSNIPNTTSPAEYKTSKKRQPLSERWVVAILSLIFALFFYLLVFGITELVRFLEYLFK